MLPAGISGSITYCGPVSDFLLIVCGARRKSASRYPPFNSAMKIILGALLLCLMGLALYDPPVESPRCSCVSQMSAPLDSLVAWAVESADAVVKGKAVQARLLTSYGNDPVQYTFVVDTVWKGPEADTFKVRSGTGEGGGDCAKGFSMGWEYLLYASKVGIPNGSESYFAVSSCDRSGWAWGKAGRDLEILERGFR